MTFAHRKIDVTITLGEGDFGAEAVQVGAFVAAEPDGMRFQQTFKYGLGGSGPRYLE